MILNILLHTFGHFYICFREMSIQAILFLAKSNQTKNKKNVTHKVN